MDNEYENLSPSFEYDDVSIAEAGVCIPTEEAKLEPEQRLCFNVIQLAVKDLEAVNKAKGRIATLSDDERLNAASAAFFFLKGPAKGYMKALGWSWYLPKAQELAISVLGALGGPWGHLVRLKGENATRRIAAAIAASRSKAAMEKMPMPRRLRGSITQRELATLF